MSSADIKCSTPLLGARVSDRSLSAQRNRSIRENSVCSAHICRRELVTALVHPGASPFYSGGPHVRLLDTGPLGSLNSGCLLFQGNHNGKGDADSRNITVTVRPVRCALGATPSRRKVSADGPVASRASDVCAVSDRDIDAFMQPLCNLSC